MTQGREHEVRSPAPTSDAEAPGTVAAAPAPQTANASRTRHVSDPPTERTSAPGVDHLSPPRTERPSASSGEPTETAQRLAERAAQALFDRDRASGMLGIRLVEVRPGHARLAMRVRPDMVNGHRMCHGGLIFLLADSAFALSCNSHNENAVAAAASIDFLAPAQEGDELTAVADELWRAGRSGIYEVTVTNQRGERIALFRGRSHRIGGQVTAADDSRAPV